MKFGLNLYSIRNLVGTPEGFLETAHKLKAMGYDTLQISGVPYDPTLIKNVSEETGMPVVLTHMPIDRILNDTDKLMEEHAFFGCKNIGLGSFPFDKMEDPNLMVEQVAQLNEAGEKMAKRGFKFFYHNHHYEFYKNNGQTVYDYMIENAPYINFTLDTYWLQYGGVYIVDYITKMSGRIDCIHLKDYQIIRKRVSPTETGPVNPDYAPVGKGTLKWNAIIPAALASGTKHFIVEQDSAALYADTLAEVKFSIDYLKANF